MPENSSQELTLDDAFMVPGALCRSYVAADLRLLSESLDALNTPTFFGVPTLFSAPRLNAKLTFDSTINEDKKFLFGLIKRERSERVAELKIDMSVAPAAEALSVKDDRIEIYGAWPRFFQTPQTENSMTLTLATGDRLNLRTPRGGGSANQLSVRPELIGPMMVTLGNWARDGDKLPAAPENSGSSDRFTSGLEMLVAGTHTVVKQSGDVLREQVPTQAPRSTRPDSTWSPTDYRAFISSRIGTGFTSYEFTRLTSHLKVVLDENGDVATDPFSGHNQRIDVTASLEPGVEQPRVTCFLKVPDLLISGPLLNHILEELASSADLTNLLNDVRKSKAGLAALSLDNLKRFIKSSRSSERAVIARTKRTKEEVDWDLILLKGTAAGQDVDLMVSLKIAFQKREVGAHLLRIKELREIKLVAARVGSQGWQTSPGDHADTWSYFYRAFASLYRWRLRFGPLGEAK